MPTTLELKLTRGPEAASAARCALADLETDVSPDVLGEVRLMVSELVTNSVRHAGEEARDAIELRASVDEERLWVEVADPGPGFDGVVTAGRGEEVGGWGLYIVESLADRWGVGHEDGMARVWFELHWADRPSYGSATKRSPLCDAPEVGAERRRSARDGRPGHGAYRRRRGPQLARA